MERQRQYDAKDEIGALARSFHATLMRFTQIAQESEKLAGHLEALPLPVFEVDRDYTVSYVNDTAARLVGEAPKSLVGRPCHEVFGAEHCRTKDCVAARAFSSGRIEANETVARPAGSDRPVPVRSTALPVAGADGSVDRCLELFVDLSSVYEVVADVRGTTDTLTGSSTRLAATSGDMAQRSAEMSARTQEVSAAVQQMSSSLGQMAESAAEMSGLATAAASSVEEVSSSLDEVARNTARAAEIARSVDERASGARQTMQSLTDAARAVGAVVKLINDIADQTNLLALNATIEAAGAGQHGAGFAVVASEVKDLARQTAKATEQIREQIQEMQANADVAAEAMSTIGETIGELTQISQSVAAAVEQQSATVGEISRHMSASSQATVAISGAVHEASTGATTITESVDVLAAAASATATDIDDSRVNAQQLSEIAERLQDVVGRFRLNV